MARRRARRRGRPKGPSKVPFPLRLYPDQKRDLQIFSEIMEGGPPVNGLIQAAVQQFIDGKLRDPQIRVEYEARLSPGLRVMS